MPRRREKTPQRLAPNATGYLSLPPVRGTLFSTRLHEFAVERGVKAVRVAFAEEAAAVCCVTLGGVRERARRRAQQWGLAGGRSR